MNAVIEKTGFDLQPANLNEAMKFAGMISNSALAPKDFKGKPEDTLVAMMMGNEIGLNPMQAIQNIAVINGRPSIWGDAMLALVQANKNFKSIEETFDDSAMTAKCVVTRKGGKPHVVTYSQEDAVQAGLWGRNVWKNYPKRMLAMRARGFALRNQFADALLGLITAEEARDIPTEGDLPQEVTPAPQTEQVIEHSQLPECSEDQFKKFFDRYSKAIANGDTTASHIVANIKTRCILTESQEASFFDIEVTINENA